MPRETRRVRLVRVLTIGTFDVLHWGHIDFLKECQKLGELTVGVNTDEFTAKFKDAPIMNLKERMYALKQLGFYVVKNDSAGRKLIEKKEPDILVVGSDWARKDYYKQIDVTQDWLDDHKIILAYVPYVQEMIISTTEIKRRIREA